MFNNIFRNIAKVIFGELLAKIFLFLTTLLIIWNLSVKEFASFVIFDVVMVFFSFLIGDGINQVIVLYSSEYISVNNEKPIDYYVSSIVLQLSVFVLLLPGLLIFSDQLTIFFFNDIAYRTPFILGLISTLGMLILNSARAVYQSQENFRHYMKMLLIYRIFIFVLVILLLWSQKMNFFSVAASICLGTVFTGFYFLFDTLSKVDLIEILSRRIRTVYQMLLQYWEYIFFIIFSHIAWRIDIFMLSNLSTEFELANYAVSYKFYSFGILLVFASHSVILPMFGKIQNRDRKKQKKFITGWIAITSLFFVAIILFGVFGKPLLMLFVPGTYSKSFTVLVILSIALWLHIMFSPFLNIIISLKRHRYFFLLGVLRCSSVFLLNFYLVPLYGGYGAAISVLADPIIVYTAVIAKLYTGLCTSEPLHHRNLDRS